MRPSRRIPLLRGFLGASFATFTALISHVGVSDSTPGMLGILVPWVLSVTVCALLAGRRLSLARLTVSVAVSQLLFHALFVLGSITPRGGFAPHVHGGMPLGFDGAAPLVPQDAGMWLAHLLAAALTVAVLHRGERILCALAAAASSLAGWLRRIAPTADLPSLAPRPSPGWTEWVAPARRDALSTVVRRRGPPVRLV